MSRFLLGRVVATRQVANQMEQDNNFADQVLWSLHKHAVGEWGQLPAEDIEQNEIAVKEGYRLLSAYELKNNKIWIITESDRSVTTVLFPEEY